MSTTDPTLIKHRAAVQAQPQSDELLQDVPPAGEAIHLPGPSIIPLVCAIGITLTIIGTTIDWIWSVLGLITFIVSVTIWIRDVRRDVDELPEEHGH
jgi:hypothetical protein